MTDKRRLAQADQRGYLLVGPDTSDELIQAWRRRCQEQERLFALEVERPGPRTFRLTLRTLAERLSLKAIDELTLAVDCFDGDLNPGGPDCMSWEMEGKQRLEAAVQMIWRIGGREAERLELNAGYFPVEGLAVCINNECMEHLLRVGEMVYIRELPNLRGHCLILTEDRPPIIGWHLERFRMATGDDHPNHRRQYGTKPTPWPTSHTFWVELEGRWSGFEGRAPN